MNSNRITGKRPLAKAGVARANDGDPARSSAGIKRLNRRKLPLAPMTANLRSDGGSFKDPPTKCSGSFWQTNKKTMPTIPTGTDIRWPAR